MAAEKALEWVYEPYDFSPNSVDHSSVYPYHDAKQPVSLSPSVKLFLATVSAIQ
jgi:hypothetical protein